MKKALLVVALLYSTLVRASSAGDGTLSLVHFMGNGVVIVYTNGSRSAGVPACASNQTSRFALDGTTPGGKVQVAGLLAAYAAGKTVDIIGTWDCAAYGDTESISYFHTVD
jgi:hypothetical protein